LQEGDARLKRTQALSRSEEVNWGPRTWTVKEAETSLRRFSLYVGRGKKELLYMGGLVLSLGGRVYQHQPKN